MTRAIPGGSGGRRAREPRRCLPKHIPSDTFFFNPAERKTGILHECLIKARLEVHSPPPTCRVATASKSFADSKCNQTASLPSLRLSLPRGHELVVHRDVDSTAAGLLLPEKTKARHPGMPFPVYKVDYKVMTPLTLPPLPAPRRSWGAPARAAAGGLQPGTSE